MFRLFIPSVVHPAHLRLEGCAILARFHVAQICVSWVMCRLKHLGLCLLCVGVCCQLHWLVSTKSFSPDSPCRLFCFVRLLCELIMLDFILSHSIVYVFAGAYLCRG